LHLKVNLHLHVSLQVADLVIFELVRVLSLLLFGSQAIVLRRCCVRPLNDSCNPLRCKPQH
jgi:hypothetical protein